MLFERVHFIYAGTLNTGKQQEAQQEDYQWGHREIVQPMYSPCYESWLLHTPAVYNWLRKNHLYDEHINRYLRGEKPYYSQQKPLLAKLKELCEQWQVVRICLTARFYICKTLSHSCQHQTKKNLNSMDFSYNYPKRDIFLSTLYCSICKQTMKVEAVVKRYPVVLILERFEEKVVLDKTEYELYLGVVSTNTNEVLVKIGSGAWYHVAAAGAKVKTYSQIRGTKCQYYFYQRTMPTAQTTSTSLTIAKPITKQVTRKVEPETIVEEEQQQPIKPSQTLNPAVQKQRIFKTQLRPLKTHSYQPQSYSRDYKYESTVKQLYVQEKEKDTYDKEYDMGKVKKVKRRKKIHRIDFNQIEGEIRNGNIKPIRIKSKFRGDKMDKH